MKISILISDKQYLIKEGLKTIINEQSAFYFIDKTVDSPAVWKDLIENIKPDIFIFDPLSYSGKKYVSNDILRDVCQLTNVLIISDDQSAASIKETIDLGIKGFLTKHCSPKEIEDALHTIYKGGRFFCQEIMTFILDPAAGVKNTTILESLSEREYEILALIGKGLTSREISEKLFISIHTVNSHRKNLLKKLGLKSPAQLIVFALENL
ncbi:MAG: response regulator transcription factor [Cyclobacteriaceae bacterium]